MVLDKLYKNCPKIKEKCYLTKFASKRVISTGNPLFSPKIRFEILKKKKIVWFWAKCTKNGPKNGPKLRKSVILRNLLRSE